jgi:diketogulonate reductase-like aldo/keto reductase
MGFNYKSAAEISTVCEAMEVLKAKGLARSIGVSNFRSVDLEPIF